jgi:hypothetical protein
MSHKVAAQKVANASTAVCPRGGRSRARAALVAGMMSAGALASVAWVGTGISSAAPASAAPARAVAAKTISLNETGQLHRTGHSGLKLNEQGTASGTIKGTIYIHLDVVSPSRVTAVVNIYPKGGSLTGSGSAAYRVNGGTASFSGTLAIQRGSGTYAGAHGSGLSFSGTIQRLSGAVTVHLSGNISS